MFDRAIIDTDRFMDLPLSAKALYFLLGMEADDEGFVSYKKVTRIHGGTEDDTKILVAKGFLISFPSGVVVITDWNKNNYLDKNRMRQTEYQKEKAQLVLTDSREYELNRCLTSRVERSIEEKSIVENNIDADAKDVSEVIKAFETVDAKNKTYYGNKTQRKAVQFLLDEYGKDKILKVVAILPQSNKTDYCPVITSPYDLKEKWGKLASSLQKIKNKEEILL